MNTSMFMVVVNVKGTRDLEPTFMKPFKNESQVIDYVSKLDANHRLQKVFEVTSLGYINKYQIIFNGRLELERVWDLHEVR